MRLRALFGAALAAVLMLAVLPSAATPDRPRAVRVDGSSSDRAESAAGCPSGTVSLDSVAGHLYKYCGQYWPLNKLPVLVHVNSFDAKPNAGAFQEAVRLAVQTWDALALVSGTGHKPSGCANAKIICVSSISNGPGAPNEVDIRWLPRGAFGTPGIATVYPPATPGPISDVEITLNRDLIWFGSTDVPNATTGVPAGAAAGIGCGPAPQLCPWKFDLVGIILHELGHALGLEDLNPGASCNDPFTCGYPNDLVDAPDYTQVMYAFYYPGSSTKRVPREGDIAGLYRVLSDSMAD